jgi:hypothetical protein
MRYKREQYNNSQDIGVNSTITANPGRQKQISEA